MPDYMDRVHRELVKLDSLEIPDGIKKTLHEYMDDLGLQPNKKGGIGLSWGRRYAYLLRLRKVALMIPERFLNPSEKDIRKVMAEIKNTKVRWGNSDPHEPSDNQIQAYQVCLKKFYKWHLGNDKKYPECVEWIKIINPKPKAEQVEPISKQERDALIGAATNARDKALISLLYDSGCRIGELLLLSIKDIGYDDDGALIQVPDGKTGARKVRIVGDSIAHIQEWISFHPKQDPRSPLFCQLSGEGQGTPMTYDLVHRMFQKVNKKSGIQRRIYPHLFRHTRATFLASKVPEAILEREIGWSPGSKMSAVYVHLNQEAQDEAILQAYGRKRRKQVTVEVETPRECPRCMTLNSSNSKFCRVCWLNFDVSTIEEQVNKSPAIDPLAKALLQSGDSSDDATVRKLVVLLQQIVNNPQKLKEFRNGLNL